MAALMTYINPSDPAAYFKFWEDATRPRAALRVVEKLAKWTAHNMLRREKDVIAHLLTKKLVRKEVIHEGDLDV